MRFILANLVHWVCFIYTLFLLVRIVGSWFPKIARHKVMYFVAFYTDPYLNLFRRVIPPIGGVLDLSPLLGFFALQLIEQFLIYILL
ncbi:MAG: putative rane protein ylmG [Chlamydiota bacterium]|jgi:YggT family protein